MQMKNYLMVAFCLLILSIFAAGCEQKANTVAIPITVPQGENDPAVWGRVYPLHYDSYLKNRERTKGYSKYRNDDECRLSPWPFQLVLFDGWGMGIEYNEPNGHTEMLKDQLKIDASRKKAGGVCLTCKTPYAPELKEKLKVNYFSKPYDEVWKESRRSTGRWVLFVRTATTQRLWTSG